jgi:hypothetical protein
LYADEALSEHLFTQQFTGGNPAGIGTNEAANPGVSGNPVPAQPNQKAPARKVFDEDLPFLLQFNLPNRELNEKYRYVIFKGMVQSEDPRLQGLVMYKRLIFSYFSHMKDKTYIYHTEMAHEIVGFHLSPSYTLQFNEQEKPVWAGGFSTGYTDKKNSQRGKYGLLMDRAYPVETSAPERFKEMEVKWMPSPAPRPGDMHDSLRFPYHFYDKKGKLLGEVVLTPLPTGEEDQLLGKVLLFSVH